MNYDILTCLLDFELSSLSELLESESAPMWEATFLANDLVIVDKDI